jgi:hypothetical protein
MQRLYSLEGTVMLEAISAGVAEQDAKRILRMLVDRGLGEGDTMRNAVVRSNMLALGLEGVALDDAVSFAGERDWIGDGPPGSIQLTPKGHSTSTSMNGWGFVQH